MLTIFISIIIYGVMNVLSCIINKKNKKLGFWYLVTALSIIQLSIDLIDYNDDLMFIQSIAIFLFIFIVSVKNIINIIRNRQSKKRIILYIVSLIYGALHFLCIEYYNLYVFLLVDIIISIVMQYIHIRVMDKNATTLIRLKLIGYIINIAIYTIIVTFMLLTFMANGTKFCSVLNDSNKYKKELKYNLDQINIETKGNGATEEVYIPVCKNSKWGYINEKGKEVIECKYDEVTEFLTIKNRTETEDITYLASNIDIAFVRYNNEYKIISKDEKVLASCKNSVVPWEIDEERIYRGFMEIRDIDSKNDVYIQLEAKEHDTNNDYEETLNIGNNVELIIEENDNYKYDIIAKKDGDIISKIEDVDCLEDLRYSDGSIPFYDLEKQVQGWIDTEGNKYYINGDYIILDVKDGHIFIKDNVTEAVSVFRDGISVGMAEDVIATEKGYILTYANKKAFYDENFRKVSQNYDEIDDTYIQRDILIVQNNGEYSIIDIKGNVLTNETYDIIKGYANSNESILESYYYSESINKASEVLKDEYKKYKEEQYWVNSIDLN